jgi:hypothetical protein
MLPVKRLSLRSLRSARNNIDAIDRMKLAAAIRITDQLVYIML